MGQHVVIIDDSRTRRIVAELLHCGAAGARWSGSGSDLIIAEVEHPRAHGMDPVHTGARS
jgi:hypothetical protein